MLIDWFTVVAQALNFIVLVWLLRRFLYRPILDAIDARETRIAAELADADAKKAEANKDRDELQSKIAEIDEKRAEMLATARSEAKAERQRLLKEARQAADAMTASRQQTLRTDARNLSRALAQRTQEEVLAIARQALGDLASSSLEERMGEIFIERVRALDGDAKTRLVAALERAPEAVVRSAFEVPAAQREAIEAAIVETLGAQASLRFETSPEVISGLELATNGQKVAWSFAEYLGSLEEGVVELLGLSSSSDPSGLPEDSAPAGETAPAS